MMQEGQRASNAVAILIGPVCVCPIIALLQFYRSRSLSKKIRYDRTAGTRRQGKRERERRISKIRKEGD